jgi:hypothetical protein
MALAACPGTAVAFVHVLQQSSAQACFNWHTDTATKGYEHVVKTLVVLLSNTRSSMQVQGESEFFYEGAGAAALFPSAAVHRSGVATPGTLKIVLMLKKAASTSPPALEDEVDLQFAPASVPPTDAASAAVAMPEASPEHSSMPPASDEAATHGGDGGCTAVALTALGVWPSSAAAVAALDAQIAPLHQKWLNERGPCEESEAGIRGEQWHEEAISNAIRAAPAGWHVRVLDIHPTHKGVVSLRSELAHDRCLIFGVTNNRWCKRVKGKDKWQPLKYPDEPANGPSISTAGWHHTIAAIDGKLRDHDAIEPLASLWLRDDNQPDRDKGWLRLIRKVWRIYPCTRPGAGCRGECKCLSGKRKRG